jgi:hypothetical protein
MRAGLQVHALQSVICSYSLAARYPSILGIVEEVAKGFTLTVFLRYSPGIDGAILLADQSVDSISVARRGVVSMIAKEQSIPEADAEYDIRLFDLGPPRGPAN